MKMFCMYAKRSLIFMPGKTENLTYLIIKRLLDLFFSIVGLVMLFPFIISIMFLIWKQDKKSPFYIADRVGKDERIFRMVKLRSMIVNADQSGIDSTSNTDHRITPIGRIIRKYKFDEIVQLWNVVLGDMSLVGPRPNVINETKFYTEIERKILKVKPGVTDLASIVFSDEGSILENHTDPNQAYRQLIWPWKSKLCLFYIEHQSIRLDVFILAMTLLSQVNRQKALEEISKVIIKGNQDYVLASFCLRKTSLDNT